MNKRSPGESTNSCMNHSDHGEVGNEKGPGSVLESV